MFAKAVRDTAKMLGEQSIPLWWPRYQAHMCTNLSMPAMLGYLMAMMYNPNNVAVEAREQLCDMFGYNLDPNNTKCLTGWGHVTCDGTVANLESLQVDLPLSRPKAMDDSDGLLKIITESFSVRTCQDRVKKFRELSSWELLSLKPKTIMVGKEVLERHFNMDKPAQYVVASTRHYSWPKDDCSWLTVISEILGIGSGNSVSVDVDENARIDVDRLKEPLAKNLAEERPVYFIVAVMDSTEEGAVDPLHKILALRQQFQAKGFSFPVHADAAWGDYFATTLPRGDDLLLTSAHVGSLAGRDGWDEGIVPNLPLQVDTQKDPYSLRFSDSITVDPHKAGTPYPWVP
ncbi:PLP-dependent transferase [Parathielavia appendiculata]|uniref:PLP-dependent transferase n=1 Tax=Parathielavia appendiculata TaxID=2587402 RepID=A0AAN6TT89_9PEZI|nr:PLP-dependent transferase [Parathielavia appendiculata]